MQCIFKGWSLASVLFLLALLFGMTIVNWAVPPHALTLGLVVAATWASSSFDPSPRSWLSIVWQYITPWVIGLAGWVCFPMGLFLGTLTHSRWVGIISGVGLGSLVSAALIASVVMMYNLLLSTVYQTQIFRNSLTASPTSRVQKQQVIGYYKQRQDALAHSMALSTWSLGWSILQGITIAGTLVLASLWTGTVGLSIALLWNMGVVATLISFHHEFRRRLRRWQRFLLIFIVLSGGVIVGVAV